ncbi:MAG: aminoacetone oxidase family FAD-binding enzyme, partial [Planctomycetaceae bacterium]
NLTNTLAADSLMRAFGRQGRFIQPALASLDSAGLRAFFAELGIATACPDGEHVYPASNRARDVRDALWSECKKLGVAIRMGWQVTELVTAAGEAAHDAAATRIAGVQTNHGFVACRCVILASGGKSYPTLGATGAGYELAKHVGHSIVSPIPALVGLVTKEGWPGRLAGASVASARVWIDMPKASKIGVTGDVLFTHNGISGPVVLDISGDVAEMLEANQIVQLRLELVAGRNEKSWLADLDRWAQSDGTKLIRSMLVKYVPAGLVDVLLKKAGVAAESRCAHLDRAARNAIASLLAGAPLAVTRTEGFDKAIVTRGGVSLKEVNPRTLESRCVSGLFFAGEVLDLDGPCGGYNLQWAFSSGQLAGESAGKK